MVTRLFLSSLQSHPDNPRLEPNADVVERLVGLISSAGGFDDAHALIVRPLADGYQVVSGHHRALAAARAGISEVPCWVREMSDEDAFMALVLENTQSELHPLEEGKHAAASGMDLKAYAEKVGKARTTLSDKVKAFRVLSVTHVRHADIRDRWRCLAEIHAAPSWLWRALVDELVAAEWTVERTRKEAGRVSAVEAPPEWANTEAIATALVKGELTPSRIPSEKMIADIDVVDEDLRAEMMAALTADRPATESAILEACERYVVKQQERTREQRQAEIEARKKDEAIKAQNARRRESVSLDEWRGLDADTRADLLSTDPSGSGFNRQANDSIEWAQWSWNPITGCQHECPYCYARDIAQQKRMEASYPNGFAPTLRPRSIRAPRTQKVPKEAATDVRYRNVFTCSMADLFGRWVPEEWIQAVLDEQAACPQWNFLMLTKFPKRMAEFAIPQNVWMGTTVDLQARVANAEAAFAKIKCAVRWLSVEPMLEPLTFSRLDLFDWIVIGGASASSKTPEWRPPFGWISDLVGQAREAGVKVYFKTNLLGNRILEVPGGLPIKSDPIKAPNEFRYLGSELKETAA